MALSNEALVDLTQAKNFLRLDVAASLRVEIPDDTAKDWLKMGLVMEDKSVEPKETKAEETTKRKGKGK